MGFPTENKSDFEGTLEMVDKVKYASAFTFIYSKRPGTPAAEMQNCSTDEEIHARFETLAEKIADCAHKFNAPYAGKTVRALIEGTSKKNDTVLRGISEHSQVVHAPIEERKSLNDYLGKIVEVEISEAKTWYLQGKLL